MIRALFPHLLGLYTLLCCGHADAGRTTALTGDGTPDLKSIILGGLGAAGSIHPIAYLSEFFSHKRKSAKLRQRLEDLRLKVELSKVLDDDHSSHSDRNKEEFARIVGSMAPSKAKFGFIDVFCATFFPIVLGISEAIGSHTEHGWQGDMLVGATAGACIASIVFARYIVCKYVKSKLWQAMSEFVFGAASGVTAILVWTLAILIAHQHGLN